MFENNRILFVSVVLSISQRRLNSKLKIYSSISMRIFTHLSLRLVCLPVKLWSTKPFIEAMMQNQVWTFYIYFWWLYQQGGHSLYLIFDQTVDLYKSNLVVDTFTLFTHVGGIMGFCKEILWILLIISSGFEYARRYYSVWYYDTKYISTTSL